jgi:hypothetical protein
VSEPRTEEQKAARRAMVAAARWGAARIEESQARYADALESGEYSPEVEADLTAIKERMRVALEAFEAAGGLDAKDWEAADRTWCAIAPWNDDD